MTDQALDGVEPDIGFSISGITALIKKYKPNLDYEKVIELNDKVASKLPRYHSDKEDYIQIDTEDKLKEFMEFIRNYEGYLGVDTETYYDEDIGAVIKWIRGTPNNKPFGVSFYGDGKGYWISEDFWEREQRYFTILRYIMENFKGTYVLHNSKYDFSMLKNISIDITKTNFEDTMTMIHLVDPNFKCTLIDGSEKYSKTLKNLGQHFLGEDNMLEELVDEVRGILGRYIVGAKSEVSYRDVDIVMPQLMKDYAVFDTELTYRIRPMIEDLTHQREVFDTYNEVDKRAINPVLDIEREGAKVNQEKLAEDKATAEKLRAEIISDMVETTGEFFNPDSDDELVHIFETIGGFEWEWFTDKNQYSTGKSVLKQLKNSEQRRVSRLSSLVLEYRSISKLLSTYIDGLESKIQPDGRVHPDFYLNPNDFGGGATKTGRLSSSNPNFQNVPKDPIEVRGHVFEPRGYFMPDDDYIFAFLDYDAQEYCVMAHYGKDRNYIDMVKKGWDVHKGTYAFCFDTDYDEVTKSQRKQAKSIGFGIAYKMGNGSFADVLGLPFDKAKYTIATNFLYDNYPAYNLPPYNKNKYPLPYMKNVINRLEIDFNDYVAHDKQDLLDAVEYFYGDECQSSILEAKGVKKRFFNRFPGIEKFLEKSVDVAKSRGWVRTYFGRRRYLDYRGAYKAPNTIIQGTCGDIMKVALADIYELQENLSKEYDVKPFKLFLTLHDEIGVMVHKEYLGVLKDIQEIMQDFDFRVPMTTGIEVGHGWAQSQKTELDIEGEISHQELIEEVLKNV